MGLHTFRLSEAIHTRDAIPEKQASKTRDKENPTSSRQRGVGTEPSKHAYALEVGCYQTKQASPKPYFAVCPLTPLLVRPGLEVGLHTFRLSEAIPRTVRPGLT